MKNPIAQMFASLFRNLLASQGRMLRQHWAKAKPAGQSTKGVKAMRGYRAQYTHSMTEMATENNLRRKAHRASKRGAK